MCVCGWPELDKLHSVVSLTRARFDFVLDLKLVELIQNLLIDIYYRNNKINYM